MKFNGYSFPHPVLGLNDDIVGQAEVQTFTVDEKSDKSNYILQVDYSLVNEDLQNLLSAKKIEFVCEINCSSTLYRRAEKTIRLQHRIKIPKDYVRENVELLFILVSVEELNHYKNSTSHPDFSGYEFDLDTGDVLAYLGEASFFAGIEFRKLKAVSNFMEVIQGPKQSGEFNVILDNPKIQVQLSKEDYTLFSSIGKKPEWTNVFHSSFVLPTLIHALYQIRPESNKREYDDKSWAKIILWRIDNEEMFKGIVFEEDNILRIAQLFLGNPNERLLKDLFNQLTPQEESEN